jgi:hypothetical protein
MRTLTIVDYVLAWPPMPFISTFPQSLRFHLTDVSASYHKYVCGACATRDSRYDNSRYSSRVFPKQSDIDEIPTKAAQWMTEHAEEHIRIALWAVSLDTQPWTKPDADPARK